MKKLLFAIAGAAAFAAFAADPTAQTGDIDVLGFENFNLESQTVTGAVVNRDDYGQEGLSKWVSTGEDSSYVTNVPNHAAGVTEPKLFADATDPNSQYLALDTEGSELQRYFTTETTNGTPTAVADTGTYIDTLVQFTVTEDEEPAIDNTTKLAIWLGVTNVNNEVTTKLYVKAGSVAADGTLTPHTYELNAEDVKPGQWYRLTVTALKNIMAKPESLMTDEGYLNGFQIQLDGAFLSVSEDVFDDSFITGTACDSDWGWLNAESDADTIAFLRSNTVFPSLAGMAEMAATITCVGFQGTGAIDDFVVTTNNPFEVPAVDFTLTLTLGSNVTSAEVTTNGVAVVFDNGTAQIREGTEVSIAQPVFATNYHLDGLTTNTVAVASPTFPFAFTMTEAIAVEITAAEDQASYPTYIDTTDAAITAKYDAWKQAVGFDDSSTSTHLNQFLLNVDESATVGDTALEITEIKQNATAGWDITIGCTLDGVGLTGTVGETIVCNGYLAVSYAASLTGPWHTENIAVTAVDATTGTVTVNVNKANAKFMKVTLTAAPAAQE